MKKLLAITSLLFLFIALNLKAQEISSDGFSPNKVRPNAIARYAITVKNVEATADLNAIGDKIPQGLELVDQQQQNFNNMSWVNGKSTREKGVTLTLSFRAETEGTYTIEAWDAIVGDKKYPIAAHTLVVDANAPVKIQNQASSAGLGRLNSDPFALLQQMRGGNRYQQQAKEEIDLGELLHPKLILPKEKIYIGESIPCEILLEVDKRTLLQSGLNLGQIIASAKDTNAFTCQNLERSPIVDTSSQPDKILYKYETVITPNKLGTYPLAYSIEGIFTTRSFFGGNYQFNETAKIDAITVNALPTENQPASFSGAIGEFNLSNTSIDTPSASVGELLKLSFTIDGVGNFDRISAPKLESAPEWKVYEPTSEFADKDGKSFVGAKTFTYRLVPQKPDIEMSPALEFSYFNPVKATYNTLKIPQLKLSISPASRINSIASTQNNAPSQSGTFDLINSPESPASQSDVSLFARVEFWLCQLAIIALLFLFIMYRRHILMLRANPAIAKNKREKRAARIALKYAKKYAYENHPKNFFESSVMAIQLALSRTEDIQASSITLKDAHKILEKRNMQIPEIDTFFSSLDHINYAGIKQTDLNLIQLEKTLGEICKKLLH